MESKSYLKTETVLLENSPRPNVTYNTGIWFKSKNRMDEFSSKTVCLTRHDAPEFGKHYFRLNVSFWLSFPVEWPD